MAEVSYDVPPSTFPDALQLRSAGQRLASLAEVSEREEAISTLFKLLHGVLGAPDDIKKRRVKKSNETFHRKLGRHPGGLEFLRATGFRDIDDPDAPGENGKNALLSMPVAYLPRLTDAHHTLASIATEVGITPPSLPGSGFNPYLSSCSKTDSTSSAKAPESWKSETEKLRDDVKKRQRELQEKVDQAPPVDLRPSAFWLSAGRRLDDVIREAAALEEERSSDNAILQAQIAAAKTAIAGTNAKFESADKKRLAELSNKRVHEACILRIICPDKSVLQVHFRSGDRGEKVLENLSPLFSQHVQESSWYIYQTPPLKRLQPKETLLAAGFSPGASLYLGFDGTKPQAPFLAPSLVEALGPAPEASAGVTGHSFSGEAMGWGAGKTLGGSGSSGGPAWLKQPKSAAAGAVSLATPTPGVSQQSPEAQSPPEKPAE